MKKTVRQAPSERVAPRSLVISRSNNWFGAFVNGVSKPKTKEPENVQSETTAEVQHAPSSRLMASPPQQRNRDFLEAKQVSLYQMFDSDEMR